MPEPAWRLDSPLTVLPGVGAKRAEALARLGLTSVGSLLHHAPRAYEDRGDPVALAEARTGEPGSFVVVSGRVAKCHLRRAGRGRSTLRATLEDATGSLGALWFNAPFLASEIAVGKHLAVAGRLSQDGAILQGEFATIAEGDAVPERLVGIRPSYSRTEGISARLLRDLVSHALSLVEEVVDPWSASVREAGEVLDLRSAVVAAHRPRTLAEAEAGRDRLLFDELLPIEVAMRRRLIERRTRPAPRAGAAGGGAARFVRSLPFTLSPTQRHAVDEIADDFDATHPMTRLLAGEVGSGKTVVAFAALEEARSRGFSAALLAPTDLLARQHARTAQELIPDAERHVVLLTGSLSAAEARRARARIAAGEARIAIGTHALLSDATEFPELGLVVVDEQHRFGVEQREALLAKAVAPHSLLLTATPIPRSLALLSFGDADVSVLEPRPDAQGQVATRVVPAGKRRAALRWIRERIDEGEQAFFVRPRIEGDGDGVQELLDELVRGPFAGVSCEVVHGRMPAPLRDDRLVRFAGGQIPVLVATTVIEVGIDVPGATILWVEGADRLGLAQLHQLRGRIARRGQSGYCWIVQSESSTPSDERLKLFAQVNEGMRLAEIDLALRGPGELLGLRQSGRCGLFAGMGANASERLSDLCERAWRAAEVLLANEGAPATRRKESGACDDRASSVSASA